VYLGLGIWSLWAILRNEGFIGTPDVDAYGTLWFYWWVEEAIRESGPAGLLGLGHTDLFFHPHGKDVLAHTGGNFPDAILAAPGIRILGLRHGYNLFIVLIIVSNGLAFYRLARRFGSDPLALRCLALCAALSPYLLRQIVEGRPTQALIAPLLLFLDQAWTLCQKSSAQQGHGIRCALIAGLLLAVTGWVYWFYALFAAAAVLAMGITSALCGPDPMREARDFLLRLGLTGLTALILVSPVAVPLAMTASTEEVPGLLQTSTWSLGELYTQTREGFDLVISSWQPLGGGELMLFGQGVELSSISGIRHTPLIALLAFLWWLFRPGKTRRAPVLALLGSTVLLAAGPALVIGDRWFGNMLYIWASQELGILGRLWWPGRAVVIWSVLSTLLLCAVLHRLLLLHPGRRHLLIFGTVLLWTADLAYMGLLPLSAWSQEQPQASECMAQSEEGALIELPSRFRPTQLYHQLHHGRPTLSGMLSDGEPKVPDEIASLQQSPWLLELDSLLEDNPARELEVHADDSLHDAGYRYLWIHRDEILQPHGSSAEAMRQAEREMNKVERQLQAHLGSPVLASKDSLLYMPWGGEPPCDPSTLSEVSSVQPRILFTHRVEQASMRFIQPIF
jgi:hypothetical protein